MVSSINILEDQINELNSFINKNGIDDYFKAEDKSEIEKLIKHSQNERSFLEGFISRALGFSVIEKPQIISNAYSLNDAIDSLTMVIMQQFHFLDNPFGDKEPINIPEVDHIIEKEKIRLKLKN